MDIADVLLQTRSQNYEQLNMGFVISVCPSVRPSAWSNPAPSRRIFIEFDICLFFENMLRKFKLH